MHRRVRESRVGKKAWVPVIRRDVAEIVVLRHPLRWRLLRRIWNVGIPYGQWGRETPF